MVVPRKRYIQTPSISRKPFIARIDTRPPGAAGNGAAIAVMENRQRLVPVASAPRPPRRVWPSVLFYTLDGYAVCVTPCYAMSYAKIGYIK